MTNPHFYWDKWKMLLVWGDPKSWRDAIGRLMEYLYAHGKFHEKNEALEKCLHLINGKYVLVRHPVMLGLVSQYIGKNGKINKNAKIEYKIHYHLMQRQPGRILNFPDPDEYLYEGPHEALASRDHWSYFIQYMKNTRTDEEFADFISKVPRMRGMNLWMKTMKGNKWGEWWFYTLFNPGAYLGNILSNLITWIGRLGPEESIHWWITVYSSDTHVDSNNNGTNMQLEMTGWQKWWRRRWVIITPFYPIQNRAWQLKWLPDSKRKERQKRILLRRTDRGNIIVRALFGDTHISDLELQKYPETTGDASGVKMNKSCDRTIEKIHNKENCYKKLLAWKLHNENVKS